MTKLTVEEVQHVAKLSNLPLTKSEVQLYQKQLSEVISYIEKLKEVNIEKIVPTSQTTGLVNKTRSDEINPLRILTQEEAVSAVEDSHNGYFVVPAVITKEHDDR